ncbi:ABC transporter ATP-binding protein [Sporolactobacillus sp. THM19-2]|uniref:ABC transporter ATP-binding protein n=1 Tax=Sporolactobacillus sp. THM19-2 TaxID=2511171 RepID=UPI001020151B|nr:dipeptide ABC transporter ATP-binding protein [Sporolactobacillus sp. THM19-2]RYL88127.1 dipeptide ABC transporter ATP-binding protein [Sporolactobacillus sp. THM19-2]
MADVMRHPFLKVENLSKEFSTHKKIGRVHKFVKAVNNVSFELHEGETYGLVGESGCGKSTTGRSILRLIEPTSGKCQYKGQDIVQLNKKQMFSIRKDLQMVFQDPYSSLNPKKRIGSILEEPMKIHKIYKTHGERTEKVMDLLNRVGLQMDHFYRFPHEFSGGQRQRIGIARALSVNPKLIVCDEPVSALDVSIQSQILNLMEDIQEETNVTYLFIAHDLSVVRHISDRIGVMYLGRLVEEAKTDSLFSEPMHPYTQALLSAIPVANPNRKRERIHLTGEIPSPMNLPNGCAFHTRCPFAKEICKVQVPTIKKMGEDHKVACHLY